MLTLVRDTIFDLEDVNELTPEIMGFCLEFAGVLNIDQSMKLYFEDPEHGFYHAQTVWNRCQEIIGRSPTLWRMAIMQAGNRESYARKVLILGSIFHDIGRSLGANFETHEQIGAELARTIVFGSCIEKSLFYAIINHDYICPLVNGNSMPSPVMLPLSEILRLADKTSILPKDEVKRYHQTGRRIDPDLPLFDPTISDDVRFNFKSNIKKGDELTWLLIIFALQSTDFLYGDARDDYAYWARGKREALEAIGDLCLEEEYLEGKTPVDPNEVKEVIIRFCKKFNLLISA